MNAKSLVAVLAILATLLTGCGAAAEATDIQEDDARWNCWTMGNRVCGANPIERTEAWAKFDLDADKIVSDAGVRVTYLGLALEGGDFTPSNHVTIASDVTPGKVHVFTLGAH